MKKIRNYPKKNFSHAVVAVDVVIFSVIKDELHVLLLKLSEKEFGGSWALPGGLLSKNETLIDAANRHLKDKANITNIHVEQLYTFGDPNRDPKGWVVSVAYLALMPSESYIPKTLSRYENIMWHSVKKLPPLSYDHKEIILTGINRLKGKLTYTNIVYTLMPKEFTFTELQKVYEIILGESLDKRNFRKKINALGILAKLTKKRKGESHRPAQLYSFKSNKLQEVNIL